MYNDSWKSRKKISFFFDLERAKSTPYILSTISHPKFKPNCIPMRFMSFCKNIFLSECNLLNDFATNSDLCLKSGDDDDLYDVINGNNNSNFSISTSINEASV